MDLSVIFGFLWLGLVLAMLLGMVLVAGGFLEQPNYEEEDGQ